MAATDSLNSLDQMLKAAREQHADEMKSVKDSLLASQLELKLTQDALSGQQERTGVAERFSVKLLTQFAMVDAALTLANKAFDDARQFALAQTPSDGIRERPATPNGLRVVPYDQTFEDDGEGEKPHYVPPPATGIDPNTPHG